MRDILTKHRIMAAFLSLCIIVTMFGGASALEASEGSAGRAVPQS